MVYDNSNNSNRNKENCPQEKLHIKNMSQKAGKRTLGSNSPLRETSLNVQNVMAASNNSKAVAGKPSPAGLCICSSAVCCDHQHQDVRSCKVENTNNLNIDMVNMLGKMSTNCGSDSKDGIVQVKVESQHSNGNTSVFSLAVPSSSFPEIPMEVSHSAMCVTSMMNNRGFKTDLVAMMPELRLKFNKDMYEADINQFRLYKRMKYNTTPKHCGFDGLQDEVVRYIFSFLTKPMLVRCAQLCKRFRRLALDYSLWRRLDLNGRHLSSGTLGRIVLRGSQYLRLSKADISGPVFSPGLEHLPYFDSSLKFLDLSMAVVEPSSLESLFSVCTKLEKISLEFLVLNDTVLRCIAKSKDLTTLNMSMCSGFTDAGLKSLFTACDKLDQLNLAWTSLSKPMVTAVLPYLPKALTRLNISGYRDKLNDNHILELSKAVPELVELDLSDCTSIAQDSIKHLVERCQLLERLSLSRCYCIRPEAYEELRRLKFLQQLSVFGLVQESSFNRTLRYFLPDVRLNKQLHSTVARPTVGARRTSIWTVRVRD
uniref:S-phase kinase-associated protein 2-like n=1 Tax=Hirondellea gigas TaxID=1518452 RepID=A0A2P2IAH1_9CRUS